MVPPDWTPKSKAELRLAAAPPQRRHSVVDRRSGEVLGRCADFEEAVRMKRLYDRLRGREHEVRAA